MDGTIAYDSTSLQTYDPTTKVGIITNSIEHTDGADKDMALYPFANANGSALPFTKYPSKPITVGGAIIGSTQANLDSRIDAFKALFNGREKNLDIGYNGTTRRYTATANVPKITRSQKDFVAKFTVTFICTDPFGRNTALTDAVNQSGRTASSYTDGHTFLGSAPVQLPIITLTFTAVTGGTGYVSFQNNANGQGITITDQTFVNGDILEIDTRQGYKTVKKNGVEIDFLGAFPEFAPGAGSFTYSDGFTTRTLTERVAYYPAYQ